MLSSDGGVSPVLALKHLPGPTLCSLCHLCPFILMLLGFCTNHHKCNYLLSASNRANEEWRRWAVPPLEICVTGLGYWRLPHASGKCCFDNRSLEAGFRILGRHFGGCPVSIFRVGGVLKDSLQTLLMIQPYLISSQRMKECRAEWIHWVSLSNTVSYDLDLITP